MSNERVAGSHDRRIFVAGGAQMRSSTHTAPSSTNHRSTPCAARRVTRSSTTHSRDSAGSTRRPLRTVEEVRFAVSHATVRRTGRRARCSAAIDSRESPALASPNKSATLRDHMNLAGKLAFVKQDRANDSLLGGGPPTSHRHGSRACRSRLVGSGRFFVGHDEDHGPLHRAAPGAELGDRGLRTHVYPQKSWSGVPSDPAQRTQASTARVLPDSLDRL